MRWCAWRAGSVRLEAFEEGVAVGVEQVAVAGREADVGALGAVVDHAPQREKLRVGAVSLVHCVGVRGGVGPQPLVEACDRVGAEEHFVLGQHVAFFGVEEEHEPQHHGEQALVDLVGVICELPVEQFAA